jgi:hypothetical protein
VIPYPATRDEYDAAIERAALYFTAVRFLGRGRYDRREAPTRAEAERLGREELAGGDGRVMIYAVADQGQQAFVGRV